MRKHIIIIALLMFCYLAVSAVSVKAEILTPYEVSYDDKYIIEKYNINQVVDSTNMGKGEVLESIEEYEVNARYVENIRSVSKVRGKSCCYVNGGVVDSTISIEVEGAENKTSASTIYFNPYVWSGNARVYLKGRIESFDYCTNCGQIGYGIVSYSEIIVRRRKPHIIESYISNVNVTEGDTVQFGIKAGCANYCRWQIGSDGIFTDLNDGVQDDGTLVSGCMTENLTLSNIGINHNGNEFRCVLIGEMDIQAVSQVGNVEVNAREEIPITPTPEPTPVPTITPVVEPTQTPAPTKTPIPSPTVTVTPTKEPTKTPTSIPTKTPIPTGEVTRTPTPAPIKIPDEPGDKTPTGPSTSSSSYKPGTSSYPSVSSSSSRTSSSSANSSSSEKKPIWEDINDEDDNNPYLPSNSSSSKNNTPRYPGKNTSSSDRKNPSVETSGGNSPTNSGTYNPTRPGNTARTIMKDGVLYILDEDDEIETQIEGQENEGELVEEYVLENEFAPGDLIDSENGIEIQTQDKKNGLMFFLIVSLGAILLLALLLFILFFGVIVEGECEENDDVFDICSIRLLYRRDGKWCVNLGESFEENAVLRLRIGILFAVIFKDCELTGNVKGNQEGIVTGQIMQKMMLYRKKIRRTIL